MVVRVCTGPVYIWILLRAMICCANTHVIWRILGTLPSRTKKRVQQTQSKFCVQNIRILKCQCLNISERIYKYYLHSVMMVFQHPAALSVTVIVTATVARFRPFIGHEGPQGEQRYSSTLFLTSALEGGEGSASRPGRTLPPGKTRYPLYRRLCEPQGRSGQVRIPGPSSPQIVAIPTELSRPTTATAVSHTVSQQHVSATVSHLTLLVWLHFYTF